MSSWIKKIVYLCYPEKNLPLTRNSPAFTYATLLTVGQTKKYGLKHTYFFESGKKIRKPSAEIEKVTQKAFKIFFELKT